MRGVLKVHSIDAMDWGTVEVEPEVRQWLEGLSTASFAKVAFYVDLLAAEGVLLGEPYSKQLDGKLRELRFYLNDIAVRITYWIAPGRRIVLLTVFYKSRPRDEREIERARRALRRCIEAAHTVDEEEEAV
ncbi:type II toxin-antitoxin system RelE/ParE family toxin [Microbispora rosea]|uniref:type II toxin-antitoxin system RelE/ParE family toxin n=2 Tax=Microbispora rosea TaxID=58117 RepID=UPI00343FDE60